MKHIIASGTIATGFSFIGPFANANDATAYAEDKRLDYWVIIELDTPE